MKINLLSFVLGCALVLLVSANGSYYQIFQPKQPTVTEVKTFRTLAFMERDIKTYIDAKVKQGYIVKSVAIMDDSDWSKAIVVMEKY